MKNNKTMIKMMIVNFKEHFYDDDEDFENVVHEDQHVKDKGWQW